MHETPAWLLGSEDDEADDTDNTDDATVMVPPWLVQDD
jgi:hypothetical protein